MSTDEDRDRERLKAFEQMPRQPMPQGEQRPKQHLTIIWETEKRELHTRLEALEADVKFLKADIKTILHAQSQYLAHRAAMVPVSEQEARFAKLQHLKHGIPEVDYEGPTEGPHR